MRDLVGHASQSGHTVKGFVQVDERVPGCPDNFPGVDREKHPGRTSPSGATFLVEIRKSCPLSFPSSRARTAPSGDFVQEAPIDIRR
jgi:hypothetical protein